MASQYCGIHVVAVAGLVKLLASFRMVVVSFPVGFLLSTGSSWKPVRSDHVLDHDIRVASVE